MNINWTPLKEEVLATQYEDNWQVSISIDGWIKLLHRHPAFSGIAFTESPQSQDSPSTWMEYTIHRSDRVTPTTVREYLSEAQNENPIWKRMPKRMLRYRALQQCMRLAMGVITPDITPSEKDLRNQCQTIRPDQPKSIETNPVQKITHTTKLKELLEN